MQKNRKNLAEKQTKRGLTFDPPGIHNGGTEQVLKAPRGGGGGLFPPGSAAIRRIDFNRETLVVQLAR